MIYFPIFWEAIPLFILSDLLYGTHPEKNSLTVFIPFIISMIILILIEVLKNKLKFYPRIFDK